MQPNLSFNIPPHGPNDTYRPASPRTVTIFNNAAQHANVFAPNTTVRAASSVDHTAYGVTTPYNAPQTPLVEVNRPSHNNADGHGDLRATQTVIHELVVHAQYDAQHLNGTAEDEHRRMFLAPARNQPNSYLAATRLHIRAHNGNRQQQQVIIDDYDNDVTNELNDAANHQGLSHQQLSGARTYHRNRVNSMTDAISQQPRKVHDW